MCLSVSLARDGVLCVLQGTTAGSPVQLQPIRRVHVLPKDPQNDPDERKKLAWS